MPTIRVTPQNGRWAGIYDNAERAFPGADAPSPWSLAPTQLLDAQGYDLRLNRVSYRATQLGSTLAPANATVRWLGRAIGQGFDKPLFLTGGGQVYHYSEAAWSQVGNTIDGAANTPLQADNGMGVTVFGFGGNTPLLEYNGTGLATVAGDEAPTGIVCVMYDAQSARFLAFKDGEDILRYCANSDRTKWTTGGGSSEFIGNDRAPLTALVPGPGEFRLIGKRDSLWVLSKADPISWNLHVLSRNRGIAGMHAWTHGPQSSVFFAHESGIWVVTSDGALNTAPLTLPISQTWRQRMRNNPNAHKYVSLLYMDHLEELWVLLPTDNTTPPGLAELWRMYVPDGSWMLEDTRTPTGPAFFSTLGTFLNPQSGLPDSYVAEEDDTNDTIKVFQLNVTGAYGGAFLRTRPFGTLDTKADFGKDSRQFTAHRAFIRLKRRGAYDVTITPTAWLSDGTTVAGDTQTFSLAGTAGRGFVAEVHLPEVVCQGIDFRFSNSTQDQVFDVEEIVIPYEPVGLGSREA